MPICGLNDTSHGGIMAESPGAVDAVPKEGAERAAS